MNENSDEDIRKRSADLAEEIMNSATYHEYAKQRDLIRQDPELYAKVNEFRRKNYEFQNLRSASDLYDTVETIRSNKDYNEFRKNPLVESFLSAELALCRLMQEACQLVVSRIDFDLNGDIGNQSAAGDKNEEK